MAVDRLLPKQARMTRHVLTRSATGLPELAAEWPEVASELPELPEPSAELVPAREPTVTAHHFLPAGLKVSQPSQPGGGEGNNTPDTPSRSLPNGRL